MSATTEPSVAALNQASTSKAAAAAAQEPTASTSTRRKHTRTRRGKKKARTAGADGDDSSDDEVEEKSVDNIDAFAAETSAAKAKDKAVEPETTSAGAGDTKDSEDEGEGEGGDGDEGKKKRKRKRTRANKKASGKVEEEAVKAVESGGDVGPDPELDLRLSEHAKKAIEYARVYSSDKASWKFNKAKQNWLLRNALACPPADYDPELATRKPAADSAKPSEGDQASEAASGQEGEAVATTENEKGEEKEDDEEGENFIPEVFVPVVTAYLKSVMGAAKQRLIETLREALNAAVPENQSAAGGTGLGGAEGANGQLSAAAVAEAPAKKSVSFGAMVMEAEQTADAASGEGENGATVDSRTRELRRQRARKIFVGMGELQP